MLGKVAAWLGALLVVALGVSVLVLVVILFIALPVIPFGIILLGIAVLVVYCIYRITHYFASGFYERYSDYNKYERN